MVILMMTTPMKRKRRDENPSLIALPLFTPFSIMNEQYNKIYMMMYVSSTKGAWMWHSVHDTMTIAGQKDERINKANLTGC